MLAAFIFSIVSWAGPHAHVHGLGQINIAFEGSKGAMEIEVPTESLTGFEFKPKTEKDKAAEKKAVDILKEKISSLVMFEASWKCQVTATKIEMHQEGSHRECHASYEIKCITEPKKGSISFRFGKEFPTWAQVKVQVLTGSQQLSADLKNGESIDLK